MGQSCRKHRRVHCQNDQNIRQPSNDAALIFLVASEKRKLKVVAQPVPSAPKLKRKQLRFVGKNNKAPGKIQHPISVPTNESQVVHLSSNRKICVSSVSSRDAIPSTSKILIIRKGKLPSNEVRSIINDITETKKIFVIEKVEQIIEEVKDPPAGVITASNACIGMAKVELESIQNTIPGQSAGRILSDSYDSQSDNTALPRRQGAKSVGRIAFMRELETQMGSKDFHDRINAIDQIVENCSVDPGVITSCIFQVFDSIRARLVESNRIVNLHMLKALETIIPLVKWNLPKVANLLIPAVVENHLNSKNPVIYNAAVAAVRALVHNLDKALLVEILAARARLLSGQAKMVITNTVADMVTELYSQKRKVVEKEVLPLLWHMLAVCSESAATATLVRVLHSQMGPRLRLQACAASLAVRLRMCLDHLLHNICED